MLSTFPKKDDLRKTTDDSLYWELNIMLNRISKGEELNSPMYLLKYNSESDFFEYIVRSDPYPKNGFTNHELDIQGNTTIFMFSDGFQDQFGGEKDKNWVENASLIG